MQEQKAQLECHGYLQLGIKVIMVFVGPLQLLVQLKLHLERRVYLQIMKI